MDWRGISKQPKGKGKGKGGRGGAGRGGAGRGGFGTSSFGTGSFSAMDTGPAHGQGNMGHGKTIWDTLPDLSIFGSMKLDEQSRSQVGELFKLLDTDGNGRLTDADFTPPMVEHSSHSRVRAKFVELKGELDFNNDGEIVPEEFVRGKQGRSLVAI